MKTLAAKNICDTDPAAVTAERAAQIVCGAVTPVTQVETVAVRAALGRIVASDITSPAPVPNHTNSAMDGYALSGDGDTFTLTGASLAGKPFTGTVGAGECVRITTGAVMPGGADRVVIQEQVKRDGDTITVQHAVTAGANIRRAGEDLAIGDVAIPAGRRLNPSHLGLAASLGFAELPVLRRPRVAFFSNGDELRGVGQGALQLGEVYDSNRYTLYGMLAELGVETVDLGIVRDDRAAIRDAMHQASACADVVITSAGASVGDADYIREMLAQMGEAAFLKVAIKPGRPLAFGKLGSSLFFGLPGNPVSVMVTFQMFVKPALQKLAGESAFAPLRIPAVTESPLKKRPGRTEYQRGMLSVHDGIATVQSTGQQGSGILRSMGEANCFIILPAESDGVEAGATVMVQPFG